MKDFIKYKMINLSSQKRQFSGDINYLIIEYLKTVPFPDNSQKEQLIKIVSSIYFLIFYFIFALILL